MYNIQDKMMILALAGYQAGSISTDLKTINAYDELRVIGNELVKVRETTNGIEITKDIQLSFHEMDRISNNFRVFMKEDSFNEVVKHYEDNY
jgi:hypothetical protein